MGKCPGTCTFVLLAVCRAACDGKTKWQSLARAAKVATWEWWREIDALGATIGGLSVLSSCFNLESEGTLNLVVRLTLGTVN